MTSVLLDAAIWEASVSTSIYTGAKNEEGHWRYTRVEEKRGVRTGKLNLKYIAFKAGMNCGQCEFD